VLDGTTLINLCREIEGAGQLFGYDNARPILERANLKIEKNGLADRIKVQFGDLNGNLEDLILENASLVTICWTLQFIRPLKRHQLIKWVYDGLVNDGALVVTEKILPNNCALNRSFIDFYYDFKSANGYSKQEIARKREALENVLVPYRIDENLDLLRRNGFEIVETFFQCTTLPVLFV
jgi:tRNA (cmo5U34)-methyltransferase